MVVNVKETNQIQRDKQNVKSWMINEPGVTLTAHPRINFASLCLLKIFFLTIFWVISFNVGIYFFLFKIHHCERYKYTYIAHYYINDITCM